MAKIRKFASRMLNLFLLALLGLMLFLTVVSRASGGEAELFGYQMKTVLSGSMEPVFKTGSIIAVETLQNDKEKRTLENGEVITFLTEDNILITHRILDVQKSGDNVLYKTKGDSNDAADTDLVSSENVRAVYTGWTIPYAGYFIEFFHTKNGALFLMIVPGILLLGYSAIMIIQGLRELEQQTKKAAGEKPA